MNGILYIASGVEYIEQARQSAESLKTTNDLPVTLVCDRPVSQDCFDTVVEGADFQYHYGDSVLEIIELPYERTVLLDVDTHICGDLTEAFSLLDNFDLAAATVADNEFTLSSVPNSSFPEYNTGVICFKRQNTADFIAEWKARYREHLEKGIRMNQPSFREALYKSDLRFATLPTEYNCRVNLGGYLTDEVKLIHGRSSDYETLAHKLNETVNPRVFYWEEDQLTVVQVDTSNQRVSVLY
jgi:hypothetical protein